MSGRGRAPVERGIGPSTARGELPRRTMQRGTCGDLARRAALLAACGDLPRRAALFAERHPLLLTAALGAARAAEARVGGGQHYSGGGHRGGGYSGGGHSSGGWGGGYSSGYSSYGSGGDLSDILDLVFFFFRIIGRHPVVGIPTLILVLYVIYLVLRLQQYATGEISMKAEPSAMPLSPEQRARALAVRRGLERLRKEQDPDFSEPLFTDFAYALYATLQQARGAQRLRRYSGYLADSAIQSLEQLSPGARGVQGVIVGSIHLESVEGLDGPQTAIQVRFESNYTETAVTGASQGWYSVEEWIFTRRRGVHSRPPGTIGVIACPACGASPEATADRLCPACGNRVDSGVYDWFVASVRLVSREQRPPALTGEAPEQGIWLPTLYDPDFEAEGAAFKQENAGFSLARFRERVAVVFQQLQSAWTTRRWELARPFETDALFSSHLYWITEYKRQKLVNVLKDIRIENIAPVKVTRDKYYVAITVRIFARMIDFTQSEAGHVVSGNPTVSKRFSEYWTFIRSRQAPSEPKTAAGTSADAGAGAGTSAGASAGAETGAYDVSVLPCPSCGAPLDKVSMAGVCEYCHTKITRGEFDWVLSRIEQDESYGG